MKNAEEKSAEECVNVADTSHNDNQTGNGITAMSVKEYNKRLKADDLPSSIICINLGSKNE